MRTAGGMNKDYTGTHIVHLQDMSADIQPPQTGPSIGPRTLNFMLANSFSGANQTRSNAMRLTVQA
jgi:hypothetical protein